MTKDSARSFTVVNAMHADGCATKFNVDSRLSGTPQRAASKAFNRLCTLKRVKGGCALYVTVKETTRGSANKEHTYKCLRKKLDKPIKIKLPKPVMKDGKEITHRVIEYKPVCLAAKSAPHCAKSHKSSGRMLSRSRRQTKKH